MLHSPARPADAGRTATSLRIVFVIAGLGAGGAERVLSLISADWVRRGRRIIVVAFDAPDDPVYHRFDPAVRVVRLGMPGGGNPLRQMMRVRRLRRTLVRLRPDLVISLLTKINVLTLAASIGKAWPVVISERNNPLVQDSHPLWNRLLARLQRRAAAIVMQTDGSLACLPPEARARAHVINNPIAVPPERAARRGDPVLTAVGRLTPQKGFDLLIDAFAAVADRHPDWRLRIWGGGGMRPALEWQIAARGMEGRIELAGVSKGPMGWTEGAHGFVLSSRYEGFANVLGEAMAAGLPVVAFDCDFGPSVLIRDGIDGLLVPAGDVPALSAEIDRLMGDAGLRDRLALAARERAAGFGLKPTIARWDRVVEDVLGGGPRRQ